MNPYYDPDKCGLKMLAFDEPEMCYEYNTLCFWATPEDHDKETAEEVIQALERVGSLGQAQRTFRSWRPSVMDASEEDSLVKWFAEHFKS